MPAKAAGVRTFVFASSCSVYGSADGGPRSEQAEVNPLTAYARSKVLTEDGLAELADQNFRVTCLRFATACGMSDRLRLDLVLNDFVASAMSTGRITVLSDGTPWRPLINVRDMARAIEWAIERDGGTAALSDRQRRQRRMELPGVGAGGGGRGGHPGHRGVDQPGSAARQAVVPRRLLAVHRAWRPAICRRRG